MLSSLSLANYNILYNAHGSHYNGGDSLYALSAKTSSYPMECIKVKYFLL